MEESLLHDIVRELERINETLDDIQKELEEINREGITAHIPKDEG